MSVWFPFLPTDLFKRKHRHFTGTPDDAGLVLLVETVKQQQVVVHACEQAVASGIRPGTALSVARAAITSDRLTVAPFDAHGARRALRALALWCHRYSPVVAVEDEQGVSLNIAGCARLFGGEPKMVERMGAAFDRMGVNARIAVAPTFAAARAVVRGGGPRTIVEQGDVVEAVSGLHVMALGLDRATIDGLAEVNIQQVGELFKLPRAALAARFGDGLLRIVDRVLGREPEVIQPIHPAQPIRVEQMFEGPCSSVEGIGLACRHLLAQMESALAVRGVGLTEWCAMLVRSDLDPLPIIVRHCAASRDATHLWRLLEPRLERANMGFGVEGVVINAIRTRRIKHRQPRWWEGGRESTVASDAGVLIDTLVNRLGPHAVMRAELRQSHIPERSFALLSVLEPPSSGASVERCQGDRPTQLFTTPVLVRVIALSPDGPVSQVEWQGATHTIISCIGPERVNGEWWQRERLLRDYFKVQSQHGLWLWLYRDHAQGHWFIHGVWA